MWSDQKSVSQNLLCRIEVGAEVLSRVVLGLKKALWEFVFRGWLFVRVSCLLSFGVCSSMK